MKDYTYSFEIKDLLTQFLCAFNDVVIKRYDNNRIEKESIEVRYVLAPKQRVMYDIVNKAQNLTLPVVAVNIASISRDTNRVFNKLDSAYNPLSETSNTSIKMPVPINIEVNMSILTRYQQDMDQILSNFVPYNNPYIILSWREPTAQSSQVVEIRSEVLWSGNISLTEPTDLSYSEKIRIVGDTNFTIKGCLFKNKNDISSKIYFIDTNFIPVNKNFILNDADYSNLFDALTTVPEIETISLSAIPTISNIFYGISGKLHEITSNFTLNKQITASNEFTIYGSRFTYTDVVLLSSNKTLSGPISSVTSNYTGSVSGYSVDSSKYAILNDNIMTLDLSTLSGAGTFNIIINNKAGWANSYDVNNFTFTNT
jgi:hypothetical protein